jgi:hypothetical protein
MFAVEVHIDVPCADHMVHVARISPLGFRMEEHVVRVYSGKPHVVCVAAGIEPLKTSRSAVFYDADSVKLVKRWPLPNTAFEWFAAMDVVTSKRVTVHATHCVRVEIDAFAAAPPRTTVIWKKSADDAHQEGRVLSLLQKLAPGGAHQERIDGAKASMAWRERS